MVRLGFKVAELLRFTLGLSLEAELEIFESVKDLGSGAEEVLGEGLFLTGAMARGSSSKEDVKILGEDEEGSRSAN
jgi:hypothetical protein